MLIYKYIEISEAETIRLKIFQKIHHFFLVHFFGFAMKHIHYKTI